MMDQLELATATTLFIVAIIFILLGANKHHKHLKKVICGKDDIIRNLKEELGAVYIKLDSKERYIVTLAANNAVLKQKVINLEGEVQLFLSDSERRFRVYQQTGMIIHEDKEFIEKTSTISIPNNDSNLGEAFDKAVCLAYRGYMTDLLKPKEEKPPIHPNLQAYYNRGKTKTTKKK